MHCNAESVNLTDRAIEIEEAADEALMAQLAAGDDQPIVSLMVRYAPRVLTLAMTAVDRSSAEEIVQEVFTAVWRSAKSFDPAKGTFRDWVLQIARNHIANELRRRQRRPNSHCSADELTWNNAAEFGPEPPELVWREMRRQALHAAVDALPPKQRQALSLAFFDELSHQQVATMLDVPLGTAKTRIRTALTSLKHQLTPLRIAASATRADWRAGMESTSHHG